jgi:hypothetical protein
MEQKNENENEIIDSIHKLLKNINGFIMTDKWQNDLSSIVLLKLLSKHLSSNFEKLSEIKENKK